MNKPTPCSRSATNDPPRTRRNPCAATGDNALSVGLHGGGGDYRADRSGGVVRILVACEESQEVCKAFRARGHEAYSADLQPCSGGHPEWHIQDDVFKHLDKAWDLMIAHPPCTHLAVSGAAWFEQKRKDGRQQAGIELFMRFTDTGIPKVCIENPVSIMSTIWRKPDQVIQPWMFGHGETKATCLWLKGLPLLIPSHMKNDLFAEREPEGREQRLHRLPPSPDRAKLRSKTFPGIAAAMASQWG